MKIFLQLYRAVGLTDRAMLKQPKTRKQPSTAILTIIKYQNMICIPLITPTSLFWQDFSFGSGKINE
jgi:hypothetical protein